MFGETGEEITIEYGFLEENNFKSIDQVMKIENRVATGIEEQELVEKREKENVETLQRTKETIIGDNGEEITIEYGLLEGNDLEEVDNSPLRIENQKYFHIEKRKETAVLQMSESCDAYGINFYVKSIPKTLTNTNVLDLDGTLKCFGQKRLLKTDRQNAIRKYKCKVCSKRFKLENYLKVHERIHMQHPYICKVCSKSFKLKSALMRHTKSMHDKTNKPKAPVERSLMCQICEKLFVFQSDLVAHLRIHTGEKPYSCTICHRRFKQKSAVKVHMNTHNAEPRFKCKVCLKAFKWKHSLRLHELMCVV